MLQCAHNVPSQNGTTNMLALQLDKEKLHESRPLYQQIVTQIKQQISIGTLPPGTRLPPVRDLARQLGLTRLTVHSAYSELQADGWVEATVGRGTFVAHPPQPPIAPPTLGRNVTPDGVMSDMLQINQISGFHALSQADPDPALFPADEYWQCLDALRPQAAELLRYGTPQGDVALRVALTDLLRDRGVDAMPDEIMVTSGVTQGLSLVARTLAEPGSTALVEQPTYLGLLNVLKAEGIQPIGVPLDEQGPQIDAFERLIVQHRPRFFYSVPVYQNPTGLVISDERRRQLLELVARYRLPLVEDDIYGRLSYDKPAPPALYASDSSGQVIYVGGVSKMLIPGLRVGYLVVPPSLRSRLLSLRRATDLHGPTFVQRALAEFLQRGRLQGHLRRVLPHYRDRRDALLRSLERWMPPGVSWTRPEGGFCCWLTLPQHAALDGLYRMALDRGVAYTPGEVFMTQPDDHQHIRLCFGAQPPEVIREGVALLAELLHERLSRENVSTPAQWAPLV
jgi:DNA-binding transcriptional MocR family regulator